MSLRTISLRCRQLLVWSAAVWLFVLEAPAQNTGVYVGGHIRRERPATVQKLKHSGFSYVILFNINVETDGTLTTDGKTLCISASDKMLEIVELQLAGKKRMQARDFLNGMKNINAYSVKKSPEKI